jgi:hypothetical protein
MEPKSQVQKRTLKSRKNTLYSLSNFDGFYQVEKKFQDVLQFLLAKLEGG